MQQSATNSIYQFGGSSELSTDLPSSDHKVINSIKQSDEKHNKKIFFITKVKRSNKTAKVIKTTIIEGKAREASLMVIENSDVVNRLFTIRNKYKSSMIAMKVVI